MQSFFTYTPTTHTYGFNLRVSSLVTTNNMKLSFTLILVCFLSLTTCTETEEKHADGNSKHKTKNPMENNPAIIAIEIVDPGSNSTETTKNTKRTIESALGYGYQNAKLTQQNGLKYMIYPYSQHDIPPVYYRKPVNYPNTNLQKSISYTLGSTQSKPVLEQTGYIPSPRYYPTTLFTTIQGNHVGGLSSHLLTPGYTQNTIPVIILRVYTNQLMNQALGIYPNLPQTNPYAFHLNSLNLQSLLSRYLHQYPKYEQYQPNVQTYQPLYQQEYSPVYQQQYQTEQSVNPQYTHEQNLQTSENYPDDAHTRVIFHPYKNQLHNSPSSVHNALPVTPATTYSQVEPRNTEQQYTSNSGYITTDGHKQFIQVYQQPETKHAYIVQSTNH